MEWKTQTLLHCYARTPTAVLCVSLTSAGPAGDPTWIGAAVETPADSFVPGDALSTADRAFGEHAHELLGRFESLPAAMTAAELYAEEWLERSRMTACACGEIGDETPPVRARVAKRRVTGSRRT